MKRAVLPAARMHLPRAAIELPTRNLFKSILAVDCRTKPSVYRPCPVAPTTKGFVAGASLAIEDLLQFASQRPLYCLLVMVIMFVSARTLSVSLSTIGWSTVLRYHIFDIRDILHCNRWR